MDNLIFLNKNIVKFREKYLCTNRTEEDKVSNYSKFTVTKLFIVTLLVLHLSHQKLCQMICQLIKSMLVMVCAWLQHEEPQYPAAKYLITFFAFPDIAINARIYRVKSVLSN